MGVLKGLALGLFGFLLFLSLIILGPGHTVNSTVLSPDFVGATPTAAVMRLMESKQVDVRPLISQIVPLEEAQRAFDSMYSGESVAPLLKP